MKRYSSNRAQKGKTAFRTPDRFWSGDQIKKAPVRYRFKSVSRQHFKEKKAF